MFILHVVVDGSVTATGTFCDMAERQSSNAATGKRNVEDESMFILHVVVDTFIR